jgi:hypothetical protein
MIDDLQTKTPCLRKAFARSRIIRCILVLFASGVFAFGATGAANASSLIYKNYIVRFDRGWDILCEPYIVKPDDWVLKIFRQKGEIAHKDFRDFLGIFERLNPHVQDIDLIRVGQSIDIPLRKLEHGTLPGQASGVVTIPFVSLAKVTDVVHQHAQHHQVQRGDTVSKLIAERFGSFGSQSYEEGIKLFQAANPEVTDLNRIYAGQRLYLPDPSIREESWYAAMYDEKGNLKERIDRDGGGTGMPGGAATSDGAQPPLFDQMDTSTAPGDTLARTADTLGGNFLVKGTYFVPRPGEPDFEIDLSRHPLLELQNGKVLFSRDGRVMDKSQSEMENIWPQVHVVNYDEQTSIAELLGAVFNALDETGDHGGEVGFHDQGVQVVVRAKWIKVQNDQRQLCIIPIAAPDERTPDAMLRYIEQHGIVLKEVLPDGRAVGSGRSIGGHAIKDILAMAPTGQKDFVQGLARALKFTYAPNVAVTFPYAGIQIQGYGNLVSTPAGNEILVDFGELYGDAVEAIRQSGLHVMQISPEDSYPAIAAKLLAGLGEHYTENPSFTVARRPPAFNTTITILGLMHVHAQSNKQTLLSTAALHPAITDLLSADGISVVIW